MTDSHCKPEYVAFEAIALSIGFKSWRLGRTEQDFTEYITKFPFIVLTGFVQACGLGDRSSVFSPFALPKKTNVLESNTGNLPSASWQLSQAFSGPTLSKY